MTMNNDVYIMPNPNVPNECVVINPDLCQGCNNCVDVCRTDVLMPNQESGQPPVVVYPEECWFCACCVSHCPVPGAIEMQYPLNQKVGWKRKASGEHFRVGMKNPPPPNTRPPVD